MTLYHWRALVLALAMLTVVHAQEIAVEGDAATEEEVDPCSAESLEDYNLGLHIGSVFILLGVSLFGSMLPVILGSRASHNAFIVTLVKLGTFFGFGTILATAFIHMLTPAAEKLTSECLSPSFTENYESWPYLFALIAVLAMQLIDYAVEGAYQSALSRKGSFATPEDHKGGNVKSVYASRSNLPGAAEMPDSDEESGTAATDGGEQCAVHGHGCKSLLTHTPDASAIAGIYIMEAGILAHSILIGVALGVTGGNSFITLLLALSFHQGFEGFAIGSAAVDAGMCLKKAAVLGALYSITTPIGIAIGIGIRFTYNPNSDGALLTEGIFDALSAGILIYVGLVELLNPLMTQSKWLRSQRWYIKILSFFSLYAGAACMAIIGKWA